MGMTLSFSSRQMKVKPRPLVGTKTFIKQREREMRDHEWSDNFGKPLIEAIRGSRPEIQRTELNMVTLELTEKAFEDTRRIGGKFWHELTEGEHDQLLAFANAVVRYATKEP